MPVFGRLSVGRRGSRHRTAGEWGYHSGEGWFGAVPPWTAVRRLQLPAATAPAARTVAIGEPIWPYAENDVMRGGHRAWERLGTGHRCETWLVWSPRLWGPAVLKLARPYQAGHPRVDRLSATLPDDAQPWPRWVGADSP